MRELNRLRSVAEKGSFSWECGCSLHCGCCTWSASCCQSTCEVGLEVGGVVAWAFRDVVSAFVVVFEVKWFCTLNFVFVWLFVFCFSFLFCTSSSVFFVFFFFRWVWDCPLLHRWPKYFCFRIILFRFLCSSCPKERNFGGRRTYSPVTPSLLCSGRVLVDRTNHPVQENL